MKSARFHRWNPPDFRVKSPTLHSSNWRVFAETLAFIILGGFHRWYLGEICWISQVKSARFHGFHEIHWISWWNPPDFTDFMKSTGFHKIRWISWNPLDFTKSAGFHGWNPPDFMNVSFWVMIKYRSFYRKTKNVTKGNYNFGYFIFGGMFQRKLQKLTEGKKKNIVQITASIFLCGRGTDAIATFWSADIHYYRWYYLIYTCLFIDIYSKSRNKLVRIHFILPL